MEKFVVIVGKEQSTTAEGIAEHIRCMPGVTVAGVSKAFIDIEVEDSVQVADLKSYLLSVGCTVNKLPEAQLMDPFRPNKIPL